MALFIKAPTKEDREILQPGTYQGVCYMVTDIGTHSFDWKGETKHVHQIVILYEVDETIKEGSYAGKRFVVSETLTLSFHEKAKLLQRVQGWLGRDLSEEELNGFDLESLIGKNGIINITHSKNGFPKVESVSPLLKNMKELLPENVEAPKWVEEKWNESEEQTFLRENKTEEEPEEIEETEEAKKLRDSLDIDEVFPPNKE